MASRKRNTILINVATFIVLEVVSLWILSSNEHQQTWLGSFSTGIKAAVWGRVDNVHRYFHLQEVSDSVAAENQRLQQELFDLRHDISAGSVAPWLTTRTSFESIGAGVVTISSGSLHNYMILDKGALDGVSPDDGVITSRGVVGIVRVVSDHYSQVMTFQHEDMSISAKVGHDGAPGVMKWTGRSRNEALLTDIALHLEVEAADTVYTSGHTSTFPAEIPLGVVESKTASSGSTLHIKVQLFEDLAKLQHVSVVRNRDKEEIKTLLK